MTAKSADKPDAPADKPVPKKIEVTDDSNVDASLEEVNESLKAMSPDLGDTDIEKVPDEEPETTATTDDDTIELNDTDRPISDELTDQIESEPEQLTDADAETDQSADLESPDAESKPETTESTGSEDESGKPDAEELPSTEPASTDLDDPAISEAIDDIVAEEADTVLAAEDEARDTDVEQTEQPKRSFLAALFATPRRRWAFFLSFFGLLVLAAIVPQSRYFALNTAGVRASVNLRVIDNGTRQPLKNVAVKAGGSSALTDASGNVRLDNVRLGSTKLQIEKRAFSTIDQPVTIGWGSNPLGEFAVEAVGAQYTFLVKDFLSDKPVVGAEATSGDGSAISDEEGKIVLTLDTAELEDDAQLTISIASPSYRTEEVSLAASNKETQAVQLVPARKHVFVSKRSGKYDIYTSDLDGKNEAKIVSGTGIERDDITLVPHQSNDIAALIATRERVVNPSGYLLSTLYVIDTKTGDLVKIDQSEQIHVIGWSDSGRLVYVKIASGESTADPKRHRLMSFNSKDYADVIELASSNSFNDVIMARNRIYYAPSNIFQDNPNPAMYAVDPDGQNQQTILDKEVYNIFHSSYEELDISTGANWFKYTLGSKDKAAASQPPASQFTKVYADNPLHSLSLWVDTRDGKGVLLKYDTAAKSDTVLVSRAGLKTPVYWLNEKYVVFRVNDGKETADYALNIEGGEPRKITDVTDTNGVDRWYYY